MLKTNWIRSGTNPNKSELSMEVNVIPILLEGPAITPGTREA